MNGFMSPVEDDTDEEIIVDEDVEETTDPDTDEPIRSKTYFALKSKPKLHFL